MYHSGFHVTNLWVVRMKEPLRHIKRIASASGQHFASGKPSTNLLIASSMLSASGASNNSSSSDGHGSGSLSSSCCSELRGGCTTSLRAASRCAPRKPVVKYANLNYLYEFIRVCHWYIFVYTDLCLVYAGICLYMLAYDGICLVHTYIYQVYSYIYR